ncbi:MAG: exodeoxyribonuclease VII small subunit [Gemmatimonadota bacterium]|nr:exodeoxyribonuclease VII small subunit [Candidatus Palauibacterales bacterium]
MSDKLNLEAALQRMEEIVEHLERDDLELDEALKLFDEGMALIKDAERKLSESEGRLKQILIDREGRERQADLDLSE